MGKRRTRNGSPRARLERSELAHGGGDHAADDHPEVLPWPEDDDCPICRAMRQNSTFNPSTGEWELTEAAMIEAMFAGDGEVLSSRDFAPWNPDDESSW